MSFLGGPALGAQAVLRRVLPHGPACTRRVRNGTFVMMAGDQGPASAGVIFTAIRYFVEINGKLRLEPYLIQRILLQPGFLHNCFL